MPESLHWLYKHCAIVISVNQLHSDFELCSLLCEVIHDHSLYNSPLLAIWALITSIANVIDIPPLSTSYSHFTKSDCPNLVCILYKGKLESRLLKINEYYSNISKMKNIYFMHIKKDNRYYCGINKKHN